MRLLRLRESIGPVCLISAREAHPVIAHLKDRGIHLDNEMALVMNGYIYTGPECLTRLALMSTRSGVFNRLNAWAFSSAVVSKALYPVLRLGRSLTLAALGLGRIQL